MIPGEKEKTLFLNLFKKGRIQYPLVLKCNYCWKHVSEYNYWLFKCYCNECYF